MGDGQLGMGNGEWGSGEKEEAVGRPASLKLRRGKHWAHRGGTGC
jgi:hypothetical protein